MKHLVFTLILFLSAIAARGADPQCWCFQGKMGGRVSVELCFRTDPNHRNIVAGYIYYLRAKKPKPILVAGSVNDGWVALKEYLPDGTVSGILDFMLKPTGKGYAIAEGNWINPKTFATYSLTTLRERAGQLPSWWPGNPLAPSTISSIPGEYVFKQWNSNYKDFLGGSAEFTYAGEDRVHFNISNCWNNIAEGHSHNHCPAVLYDNEFEYDDVNECGYCVRAIFFKKFVVIQATAEPKSYDCFGLGATLEGVYIKTKSFD